MSLTSQPSNSSNLHQPTLQSGRTGKPMTTTHDDSKHDTETKFLSEESPTVIKASDLITVKKAAKERTAESKRD
jgi:hypothetical protein